MLNIVPVRYKKVVIGNHDHPTFATLPRNITTLELGVAYQTFGVSIDGLYAILYNVRGRNKVVLAQDLFDLNPTTKEWCGVLREIVR